MHALKSTSTVIGITVAPGTAYDLIVLADLPTWAEMQMFSVRVILRCVVDALGTLVASRDASGSSVFDAGRAC